VSSLLVALIIFATAFLTVAFGVFAAHFSINGILYAFTRQRARATMTLVQNHASGD
jgi:hypothetical protein